MAVSSAATCSLALLYLTSPLLANLGWSSCLKKGCARAVNVCCVHIARVKGRTIPMHAVITSIACNPQPASFAPTMDALLRAAASGEYGSDTRTEFFQAGLEHEKLIFVTSPFLHSNLSSNTILEWQAQHSPILLSPDSIASMLRSRYTVFTRSY